MASDKAQELGLPVPAKPQVLNTYTGLQSSPQSTMGHSTSPALQLEVASNDIVTPTASQHKALPETCPPSNDVSATKSQSHLSAVRKIVKSFITRSIPQENIRFDTPQLEELHAAVVKEINALEVDVAIVQPWISWSCKLGECCYPHHTLDLKVFIVVCTVLVLYIDDYLVQDPVLLQSFQRNIAVGQPQTDPILECLVKKVIPRIWDYVDSLPASALAVSFYEFVNGNIIEVLVKEVSLRTHAPNFPEYIRLKSGIPTPYAYWIFPRYQHPDVSTYIQAIPDLLVFINYTNDILSFYKEELAGEKENFIHMRARISGKSVVSILEDICNETVKITDNISSTLIDKSARAAFQEFISGYMRFHFCSDTRYHLKGFMTGETEDI